ncbi:hypothetical protein N0V86_008941 [Didymella sp. IMI 355093]|nr:hypothetical protein N0V86_008941 [Didymella sp. IMI 355093]
MVAPVKRVAADLINNPTLSDVTIKQISIDGTIREYYAHKAVLCMESRFFHKAFTGNFKEASENVISLRDDVPDHFELLLRYMYTDHYDTEEIST